MEQALPGAMCAARIAIIVPTYNERENVGSLIEGILDQGLGIDVWVADDGSPDGTAAIVGTARRRFPGRVELLLRSEKLGRGAAVIAAFKRALADPRRYDYLLEMDADFSHHPDAIPSLVDALSDYDMVIGSRYIAGGGSSEWGMLRPALSWLANKYVSAVAGVPVRDMTSGYRAYRRSVLEAVDFDRIKIKGYAVHGEIAYQAWVRGFRLGEVPIHFRNRRREASKLTLQEVYMAFLNFSVLRLRYGRPRPLRER
jgi:dolichol-phosphate mannosyltransferase